MRICVVFKQNVCLYPRISLNVGEKIGRSRKNPATTPPPPLNRVGSWRSRKSSATSTTPPPLLNLVGSWRSRKILKKFNNLNLAALLLCNSSWPDLQCVIMRRKSCPAQNKKKTLEWKPRACQDQSITSSYKTKHQHTYHTTVVPHLTVTSLVRKPPNYSHPGSVPNYIPQCK